jgi:hypothetical protein
MGLRNGLRNGFEKWFEKWFVKNFLKSILQNEYKDFRLGGYEINIWIFRCFFGQPPFGVVV